MIALTVALSAAGQVVAVSPVYETDPVGGPEQADFLNAVVVIETDLTAHALLDLAHTVEAQFARVREQRWGPRTLDVDIVWMDGVTVSDDRLTIPHPRWKDRRFVLVPLRELAPELVTTTDIDLADGRVWPVEPLA